MPSFNVSVDHESLRDEIVIRLRKFSDQVRDQSMVEVSALEENWDDSGNLVFSFLALGFKVSGTMVTCEERVTVAGKIPFAAVPFRGSIERQIADNIRNAIET